MATLLVGLSHLQGGIEQYQSRYDLVEIRSDGDTLPKPATLKRWRRSARPGFAFSVVLPRPVCELAVTGGPQLERALESATALEARCLVVQTPSSVRPTASNRRKLEELFSKLPSSGVVLAWEPAGLWEPDDVFQTSRSLGAVPVVDAACEDLPPGPVVYTRLRDLGGTGLSGRTLDRMAQQLGGRREVFVIVEDVRSALRFKRSLAERLGQQPASAIPTIIRPSRGGLSAEDEEQ